MIHTSAAPARHWILSFFAFTTHLLLNSTVNVSDICFLCSLFVFFVSFFVLFATFALKRIKTTKRLRKKSILKINSTVVMSLAVPDLRRLVNLFLLIVVFVFVGFCFSLAKLCPIRCILMRLNPLIYIKIKYFPLRNRFVWQRRQGSLLLTAYPTSPNLNHYNNHAEVVEVAARVPEVANSFRLVCICMRFLYSFCFYLSLLCTSSVYFCIYFYFCAALSFIQRVSRECRRKNCQFF